MPKIRYAHITEMFNKAPALYCNTETAIDIDILKFKLCIAMEGLNLNKELHHFAGCP